MFDCICMTLLISTHLCLNTPFLDGDLSEMDEKWAAYPFCCLDNNRAQGKGYKSTWGRGGVSQWQARLQPCQALSKCFNLRCNVEIGWVRIWFKSDAIWLVYSLLAPPLPVLWIRHKFLYTCFEVVIISLHSIIWDMMWINVVWDGKLYLLV